MKFFLKFTISLFVVFSFAFLLFSSDDEEKKEPKKEIITAKTEQEFLRWYTINWVGKPIEDFIKKYGEAADQYLDEPNWDDIVEIPGVAGGIYVYDMHIYINTPDNTCGRATLWAGFKK